MAKQLTVLRGVHHTARPTWKLKETVDFYTKTMGLEMVHAIAARGWGDQDHPDFLHFFFGSGKGSTIAFFYYLNTPQPEETLEHDSWLYRSVHTAWAVDTREELLAWRARFESFGCEVMQIRHELLESVYVYDPNGYFVEVSWQVRALEEADAGDARLTLGAAIAIEEETGERVTSMENIWQRKAELVSSKQSSKSNKVAVYILDVPEFHPIIEVSSNDPEMRVSDAGGGYFRIEGDGELVFNRKQIGFNPAIWYSVFSGGVEGRIVEYGRNEVRIVAPIKTNPE